MFYGGGWTLFKAQLIGNAIITISTFVIAMLMFTIINAMGMLRVTKEMEQYGLDLHEHGIPAYPEYVLTTSSSSGAPPAAH